MGEARTRWVLCGGASSRDAPDDALRLAISRGGMLEPGQFKIELGGVEKLLLGNIPDIYNDLIEIAAYVHVADQATSRGEPGADDNGKGWRRRFRFVIPVRCVDFWSSPEVKRSLESLLRFLSDDAFRFEFAPLELRGIHQLVLSVGGEQRSMATWSDVKSVILFSGGLDSFTGAYEELVDRHNDAILVSHSAARKLNPVRTRLVEELRQRAEGRGQTHISLAVDRARGGLDRERTQRARSFLFAAIAGAVAHVAGCRRIRFYENGIVALNLPISAQVVGARASRTVHPRVLTGLADLLSRVDDRQVSVENPFSELTRAEVTERLRDMGGKDLFPHTRSCADTIGASSAKPHCGVCSQCVDRRMAAVAAGIHDLEPADLYRRDLLREELEGDADRLLIMGYVSTALTWAELRSDGEFAKRHGEIADALPALARLWRCDVDTALKRAVDLHRRHGKAVLKAIGTLTSDSAAEWLQGRLPPGSMVMTLFKEAAARSIELRGGKPLNAGSESDFSPRSRAVDREAVAPDTPPVQLLELLQPLPQYMFCRMGKGYLIGLKGQPGIIMPESKATSVVAYLIAHAGEEIAPLTLNAAAEGKTPPVPENESGLDETINKRDLKRIRRQLEQLKAEKEEAEANGDTSAAWEKEAKIKELESWLSRDTWKGKGKVIESAAVQRARDALRRLLSRFFAEIRSEQPRLADYFEKYVTISTDFRFTDTDSDWKL